MKQGGKIYLDIWPIFINNIIDFINIAIMLLAYLEFDYL